MYAKKENNIFAAVPNCAERFQMDTIRKNVQ